MKKINYVQGDATSPIENDNKNNLILHICNNKGAWGAGFVMALSAKWDQPESEYRRMSTSKRKLGNVQLIPVEKNLTVANMIAQDGLGFNEFDVPPVSYSALKVCLEKVFKYAKSINATINMPRIGCGLSGGSWDIIEFIINKVNATYDLDIFVYDFVNEKDKNYVKANLV